jgi:hypothetical protein
MIHLIYFEQQNSKLYVWIVLCDFPTQLIRFSISVIGHTFFSVLEIYDSSSFVLHMFAQYLPR